MHYTLRKSGDRTLETVNNGLLLLEALHKIEHRRGQLTADFVASVHRGRGSSSDLPFNLGRALDTG